MRNRIITWAVSAALIAGAVSACGGSSKSSSSSTSSSASSAAVDSSSTDATTLTTPTSSTTTSTTTQETDNGVASQSANGIVDSATKAINGVTAVHVAGSLVSGGTPITLNLRLVANKGGTGSMSQSGLEFRIISLGNTVYLNGSQKFWEHFGGSAAATLFNGKWLKAPATGNLASVAQLTDLHKLLGSLLASHGTLTKGSATTINGQKVIAVTDSNKGGTLYVSTTGQPYPVQVVKTGTDGGKITFDEFNQPVKLAAPAGAIDISKLQSSTTG